MPRIERLLQNTCKAAVDCARVPELRGVNFEPYRKPSDTLMMSNLIELNHRFWFVV
jgi:hypothetical protein